MYKITSLFLSALLAAIPVVSMERRNPFDSVSSSPLLTLPEEASIIVVAACENKNALRQTCKRFCTFASRRKNENILVQPLLHLTQEALDRYLLYYGALGNLAVVRNLLAKGTNPNACEDNGTTLMHHAVRCGYDAIANTLLEHPDLIKLDLSNIKRPGFLNEVARNQFGEHLCLGCASKPEKLLHSVIQQGWYEAVEYLLENNVSANAKNKKGEPALVGAMKAGYINIMKLLISKGARITTGYENDQYDYFTPLGRAVEGGYTSALQLLIDHGATGGSMLLHRAAEKGYILIVKVLLENGAEINLKKEFFWNSSYNVIKTPLDVAGNEDVRKFLIAHGGEKSSIYDSEWWRTGRAIFIGISVGAFVALLKECIFKS